MSSLFAFLHHVAAFTVFAALAVELVLLRDELSVQRARKIQRVDLAFGISAGVVLVIGLLRVFYFEKGAAYYFHSIPFIVKLSLFAAVGLASIYPTMKFVSWRGALKEGRAPMVAPATLRTLRMVVHTELAGIVVIILCAALMARGVGYVA
jgi:putative membrane protein